MGSGSYPCTYMGSVFKRMSFSSLASHREGGLGLEMAGCSQKSPAPGMGWAARCCLWAIWPPDARTTSVLQGSLQTCSRALKWPLCMAGAEHFRPDQGAGKDPLPRGQMKVPEKSKPLGVRKVGCRSSPDRLLISEHRKGEADSPCLHACLSRTPLSAGQPLPCREPFVRRSGWLRLPSPASPPPAASWTPHTQRQGLLPAPLLSPPSALEELH